jgi:hypothetical protein
MHIPRWRIALTGGALIVLGAAGFGLVQAAAPTTPVTVAPAANASAAPAASPRAAAPGVERRALRGLRRIVHGTVTIDHPKDGLITVQLDGGTISTVGADSMTIAEKGGGSVTVALNTDTRVRKNRAKATIGDLKVGDQVIVASRVAGETATARLVIVPPATKAAP